MSVQIRIPPIFRLEDKDGKFEDVVPRVTLDNQEIDVSEYIESLSSIIQSEVNDLVMNQKLGDMTISAYVLLDTLARLGKTELSKSVQENPALLRQASLLVAIGMIAGAHIPEGVKVETETIESTINLWGSTPATS